MKLTWRISLLIFFILCLSTFSSFWLTNYQAKTLHRDSEEILVKTVVKSLRDAMVQDVINGNRIKVTDLLRTIVSHENPIEYLYVTTTAHQIFAHSFKTGFPAYLLHNNTINRDDGETHLSHKYSTSNGIIYEYSAPLLRGLEMTLHIGVNQTFFYEKFETNQQFVLLLGALVLLLSIIVTLYWSRKITQPLSKFSDQIALFGQGKAPDFTSLGQNTPIEITQLAKAMQAVTSEKDKAILLAQQRENNLSITLNSIGDAVITTDAEGLVTRMNPVAEQLTKWPLKEAIGKNLKTIFPIINATTKKPIANPVEQVINTGQIVYLSNHTTLISRDGKEYQIADSAAPIKDNKENIIGVILVFNDVTEQYLLREAAAKSRRDLQAIMDHAPVSIYVKNLHGQHTFINRKYTELLDISSDEALGKTADEVFPAEIANIINHNDRKALESGLILDSEEYIPIKGKTNIYSSTRFPLLDTNKNAYAICCISTDITERKNKDEQLRHSQKMDALGKLTGGIAHDYNNMLGVIMGYTELLMLAFKDDSKHKSYIDEIYKASNRGAQLTKKLLSFSRQKMTDSDIHDINKLLNDQQNMLEKTLTPRIQLKLKLDDDLWPVLLDSNDLIDAVVNMCINSMHAIDGHGKITIHTYNEIIDENDAEILQIQPGDYVLLSITDTGKGMDDDTLAKVFDPFFTTKGELGTGLGMSQVYGFVERSNGTIRVYSEQDHGTRVTLYFPRNTDDTDPSNDTENDNRSDDDLNGSETILIVDDEPSLLKLTENILSTHGYKTYTANNGKEALSVLEHESIDLLLTDVIMPELDGYELARIVQKKYPSVIIQIASGFSDDRHIDMVDDSLHKNLLHKPYHSITLLKRLRQLLD